MYTSVNPLSRIIVCFLLVFIFYFEDLFFHPLAQYPPLILVPIVAMIAIFFNETLPISLLCLVTAIYAYFLFDLIHTINLFPYWFYEGNVRPIVGMVLGSIFVAAAPLYLIRKQPDNDPNTVRKEFFLEMYFPLIHAACFVLVALPMISLFSSGTISFVLRFFMFLFVSGVHIGVELLLRNWLIEKADLVKIALISLSSVIYAFISVTWFVDHITVDFVPNSILKGIGAWANNPNSSIGEFYTAYDSYFSLYIDYMRQVTPQFFSFESFTFDADWFTTLRQGDMRTSFTVFSRAFGTYVTAIMFIGFLLKWVGFATYELMSDLASAIFQGRYSYAFTGIAILVAIPILIFQSTSEPSLVKSCDFPIAIYSEDIPPNLGNLVLVKSSPIQSNEQTYDSALNPLVFDDANENAIDGQWYKEARVNINDTPLIYYSCTNNRGRTNGWLWEHACIYLTQVDTEVTHVTIGYRQTRGFMSSCSRELMFNFEEFDQWLGINDWITWARS